MLRRLKSRETVAHSVEDDLASGRGDVATLFAAHADAVAAWAARLGGPSVDAEDVVQEVFIVVQRQLPRFRRESSMTTWLYGITANVARQHRRKAARRRWFGLGHAPADDVPSVPTPIEGIERQRRIRAVYRVLDAMSEVSRTVLILAELEEASGERIAELTQTKLGTVWVRLHRARAEFARLARRLVPDEVAAVEERRARAR